jgi:hypothetical protein
MPLVNLPIGKGVHAEGDETSIQDGVSQSYINCYVDGTGAVRRIPAWKQFCDLATAENVDHSVTGIYHSRLHGKVYASSENRIFEILSDSTAVDIQTSMDYLANITQGGLNYIVFRSDPSVLFITKLDKSPVTTANENIVYMQYSSGSYVLGTGVVYIQTTLQITGLYKTATDFIITTTTGNRTLSLTMTAWSEPTYMFQIIASLSPFWTPPTGSSVTTLNLTASTPVSWAEDGTTVFFSARSPIYWISGSTIYSLPATAPQISTTLGYIGGYLLSDDQSSTAVAGDTAYSDDKANGYATWEVYNNELVADALSSLVVQNATYVYNIGDFTIETSYISGDPLNVFATNKGRTYNFGALAKYSVVYDQENIYMLSQVAGSRRIVIFPWGAEPQVISTPVDIPLEQFRNVTDARGYILTMNGSTFYALTFPRCDTTINDVYYSSITLAYHLQGKEWYILGEWSGTAWSSFNITSACYVESFGKMLFGTSMGKIMEFYAPTARVAGDAVLSHEWRDDSSTTWNLPRVVTLSTDLFRPVTQKQCGLYHSRQHRFSYEDDTANGGTFRCEFTTGNITHKTSNGKRADAYWYDVKRGHDREFILNRVQEDVTGLTR